MFDDKLFIRWHWATRTKSIKRKLSWSQSLGSDHVFLLYTCQVDLTSQDSIRSTAYALVTSMHNWFKNPSPQATRPWSHIYNMLRQAPWHKAPWHKTQNGVRLGMKHCSHPAWTVLKRHLNEGFLKNLKATWGMLPKPRYDGVFSQRGTSGGLTTRLFPINVTWQVSCVQAWKYCQKRIKLIRRGKETFLV